MLLFLKERKHEFPQNISKLNEQESTFADHITENSPEEISDFRGWEGSAGADGRWLGRGAVEMSIDVNEAIMWYVGNDSSAIIQTATGPPVIAEGYQDNGSPIITAVVGLSVWNRTQQGFWPRGRNEQKW